MRLNPHYLINTQYCQYLGANPSTHEPFGATLHIKTITELTVIIDLGKKKKSSIIAISSG
jgi:hypothetical protein